MRREITTIFTNQSCLQYKPWKCSRKQLTAWFGRYRDKTWYAATNTITNHSELNPKVLNSVNRNASNEMSEYLHDKIRSMLCNKPDEITTVMRVFCPVVLKIILSLAHVVFTKALVKIQGTATNCVELAFAIMCRLLNTEASAMHYRISTVLSKLMTKSSFGEKSERSL